MQPLVVRVALRDLGPGQLHAVELRVSAAAKLEPDHDLEVREAGHLGLEAGDGLLDELGS